MVESNNDSHLYKVAKQSKFICKGVEIMKKRWNRVLALLAATSLFAGCLSGCAAMGNLDEPEGTSTSTEAETTETEDGGDDAIVLKAVIKDMSPDDEVSTTFLEKVSEGVSAQLGKTVKIELEPISEGTYSESMGLLLQSGEIPDLMYFQGGDYQFAITQGILEDLTSYIEGSTYVKAMLQPNNEARITNYPYLLWLSPDRIKVPVVRTDWLDACESSKALLEDPSPENYKAFFTEIKEKNGLNAAITVPGDITEMDTIFNAAFGVTQTWLKQDDGTYTYSKISEQQKEKLKYYAELYKEGLLDNEWLSQQWDTKESAFYDGTVGVVSGTEGAVVNVYNTKMVNQNGDAAALTVLPPASGVAQSYSASDISKESRGWAISAYSENKDAAFAVLEYMASPEGQILDKLGYEGEHYTVDNDVYTLTDKFSEWYARFHESTATFDVNINPDTPYFSPAAEDSLKKVTEMMTFDNIFVMPDEYVTNWDAGEALCSEYIADVISGKKSVDDSFDAFAEDWKKTVGEDVLTYANTTLAQ